MQEVCPGIGQRRDDGAGDERGSKVREVDFGGLVCRGDRAFAGAIGGHCQGVVVYAFLYGRYVWRFVHLSILRGVYQPGLTGEDEGI